MEVDKEVNIQITSIADNIELCVVIYDKDFIQQKTYNKNEGQPLNVDYLPPYSGTYYLKVESCDSAFDPEIQYQMTFGCDPINSISDSELLYNIITYPNPFNDYLVFESVELINQEVEIELFDITGKRVFHEKAIFTKSHQISTGDIANGLLMLKVKSKNKIFTSKIYKQQ